MLSARPLIQNATHPNELFSQSELNTIKAELDRKFAEERYGKSTKISQGEQRLIADLLELARFHGYYPNGIKSNKEIRWAILSAPTHYPACVVITVIPCKECGGNLHAHHYSDEQPRAVCQDCQNIKKNKTVPAYLKSISTNRPKMSVVQREARIAFLRKQKEKIK